MGKSRMAKSSKVKFQTTSPQVLTMWNCVKTVINNEIPETPADTAFLMEVMGDLSKIHKPKAHDAYKVSMAYDKLVGIWHCMNVVIMNDLVPSEAHKVPVAQAMSGLAILLDSQNEESPQPEESSIELD